MSTSDYNPRAEAARLFSIAKADARRAAAYRRNRTQVITNRALARSASENALLLLAKALAHLSERYAGMLPWIRDTRIQCEADAVMRRQWERERVREESKQGRRRRS